jgi:hypothetical protein
MLQNCSSTNRKIHVHRETVRRKVIGIEFYIHGSNFKQSKLDTDECRYMQVSHFLTII